MTGSRRRARLVSALAAAEGLALLARPVQVSAALGLAERPPPARVVRVLGARQVLQHAAVVLAPTPTAVRVTAATELLHAASMLAAAVLWPRHARSAVVSAALAGGTALAGLATTPPASPRPDDALWAPPRTG